MGHGYCIQWSHQQVCGVYLDDITLYSKNQYDHIPHLKTIFELC